MKRVHHKQEFQMRFFFSTMNLLRYSQLVAIDRTWRQQPFATWRAWQTPGCTWRLWLLKHVTTTENRWLPADWQTPKCPLRHENDESFATRFFLAVNTTKTASRDLAVIPVRVRTLDDSRHLADSRMLRRWFVGVRVTCRGGSRSS